MLLCWINRHEYNQSGLGAVLDSCWILPLPRCFGSIPHLGKKLQTVRGQLWILSMGRLILKRIGGGWINHWIDFSNMHNVIVKPTEWSNSTGELAHLKLHPMDQDSTPWRTWLSSASGYTWVGKIFTSSKGSIIQLNHDRLGSGYWP